VIREFKGLSRNYIYPLNEWRMGAHIITVKCVNSRYSSQYYFSFFSREPRSDEEKELMEKFVGLSHALECPRPDRCPTCLKYVDQLARSF
jgi:hypothetical protein